MSWPPSADEQREILKTLPAGAESAEANAVWAMIERAVREFFDTAERDEAHRGLLRQIVKASAKSATTLQPLALQLSNFPSDRDTEALLQHVDALRQICSAAEVRAALYLSNAREGRLFTALSLAWTGPGKGVISVSAEGPFVDFMHAIVDRILPPRSLDVKRFVRREKARRKAINVIHERIAGQSGLIVNPSGIYEIDGSGQRKSD
jgi:hypothetical protein